MRQEDAWGLHSVTAGPSIVGLPVPEPMTGVQPPLSPLGIPSLAEMQWKEDIPVIDTAEGTVEGHAQGIDVTPIKPWDVAGNGQEVSS